MPDHNPKIKILTDEELAFAIKACEEKAMWPLVACLKELVQFREIRKATINHVHEVTVAELKHELEKDRKAKGEQNGRD